MAASLIGGAVYNTDDASGAGLATGGRTTAAGDLLLHVYKWDDSGTPTLTLSDDGGFAWTQLTSRALSNLKYQCAYAPACPDVVASYIFCEPNSHVAKREAGVLQVRGVDTTAPLASADNMVSRNGTSSDLTGTTVDPGSDGGIVFGVLVKSEDGVTATLDTSGGWALVPDTYGVSKNVRIAYKIVSGAGAIAPTFSFSGNVHAMMTTLAFKALPGATASIIRGYLHPDAVGRSLTVFTWSGEPDVALAHRTESVTPVSGTDPQGKPAAVIDVPSPAGAVDGDSVILTAEDPLSDDVSSWRVPGHVIGTAGTLNSVAAVLECMNRSNNPIFPDGTTPNARWAKGPALVVMGSRPQGSVLTPEAAALIPAQWRGDAWWNRITMWWHIFRGAGSAGVGNTRVQLRKIKIWIKLSSTNGWVLLREFTTSAAGCYTLASFGDSGISVVPRSEASNGGGHSWELRMDSNFLHGYGDADEYHTYFTMNPADIRAVAVTGQARKIMDNPAGTDDRSATVALVSFGADYHPPDLTGYPAGGKPSVFLSRSLPIGIDYTPITAFSFAPPQSDQENPAANPIPGISAAEFSGNPFPFD